MSASVNTERNHAFVVRLSDIKKIWDLLQNRIGSVSAVINCKDGILRDFDNWKQFSNFENPPQKKICHLTVKSKSDDWNKTARIVFSDSSYRAIDISIEGSEQVVSRLYDDISDILDGIKPWYSRITRLDFFYVIGFIFMFGIMVLQFYSTGKPKSEEQSMEIEKAILATASILGFFGCLALMVWGLNKLRSKYFPVAYFAIGQGEERYSIDEKIRWCIVVAFAVSISASLVASYFQ